MSASFSNSARVIAVSQVVLGEGAAECGPDPAQSPLMVMTAAFGAMPAVAVVFCPLFSFWFDRGEILTWAGVGAEFIFISDPAMAKINTPPMRKRIDSS